VTEEVRISGLAAPHLVAGLPSMEEKESSPCHCPPNLSMPNAYPSPVILLERHFFSPSPVPPQPAWRILLTSSWLSLPSPALSPHPGTKLLRLEYPGLLN